MSNITATIDPESSISEAELGLRWDKCPRTLLIWRQAGRLPPHFLANPPQRTKPQIRYRLADVIAAEKNLNQNA